MLALVAGATLTPARAATLKVGDPAPKLQVGKWVQGDPVKEFSRDKAYIVEFWATWCGPCRVSIPHLNEVYTKFKDKDLVVIGQDCWEQDEAKVAPFVKDMGEKMTYRVALDNKDGSEKGKMAETWMEAAGQNGIPSAFLIDKQGVIVWIGHPMQLKESMIEEVIAGKFDVKKAAAEAESANKSQGELMKLGQKLGKAITDKQWDEADTTINEIEKLLPADQRGNLAYARFSVFVGKGDAKGACKCAAKVSEDNLDNGMLQNQLAWTLLTAKDLKDPDLDVIEKIAVRASDATKGKDPAILDTLARAYFVNGKKDQAIATQEKALKLAEDDAKDQFRKTLDSYKDGKLPPAAAE